MFHRGSVLNETFLEEVFEKHAPDTVMHFAALTHVDLSFTDGAAREFVRNNVLGTHALLEVGLYLYACRPPPAGHRCIGLRQAQGAAVRARVHGRGVRVRA